MCLNDYSKLLEFLLLKVYLHNESKVARFVSGLRRDIQDLVELYKYSSIENVLHLALKVESQMKRKYRGKRRGSYIDNYTSSWNSKEK